MNKNKNENVFQSHNRDNAVFENFKPICFIQKSYFLLPIF